MGSQSAHDSHSHGQFSVLPVDTELSCLRSINNENEKLNMRKIIFNEIATATSVRYAEKKSTHIGQCKTHALRVAVQHTIPVPYTPLQCSYFTEKNSYFISRIT